jgi:hypothetical protein
MQQNGFLALHLQDDDEIEHDSAFTVGKWGMKTGLMFGTKSNIEAVIRYPSKRRDAYAWEMLIILHSEQFSPVGDSGSSVFDLEGRVVGLVTGSNSGKMLSLGSRRAV